MVDRVKRVDNVSREHKKYEEIVKDALNLHDKLLEMGFERIAEDMLKIHDKLLEVKEKNIKSDIDKQVKKFEKGGGEDTSKSTSLFLRDEKGHIYGEVGVSPDISQKEPLKNEPARRRLTKENMQEDIESYRLFLQSIRGSIGLWLDEDFVPTFIDGAVKEITGYSKEDFLSIKLKWTELVIPEDLPSVLEHIEWVESNPNTYAEIEYRIRRKDGEIRWIREVVHVLPENHRSRGVLQGFVRDINEQKQAEERRMRYEEVQKKEIHHRIKNNLQVISSLLDLQAEKLATNSVCDTTQINEAFKESRNRIASMALIHEELYKSEDTSLLDFSVYLTDLTAYLFDSYKNIIDNISLKLSLEQINLSIDTAIPLGSIITELISNALKHAFPDRSKGEINILLFSKENYKQYLEKSGNVRTDSECRNRKDLLFVLVVKDNGIGFPKEIDFKNTDTLGLQIVTTLVEQIDGCIELRSNESTEFTIWFDNAEM